MASTIARRSQLLTNIHDFATWVEEHASPRVRSKVAAVLEDLEGALARAHRRMHEYRVAAELPEDHPFVKKLEEGGKRRGEHGRWETSDDEETLKRVRGAANVVMAETRRDSPEEIAKVKAAQHRAVGTSPGALPGSSRKQTIL